MVRISLQQQIHFNVKDSLEQTVSLWRGLTVFDNQSICCLYNEMALLSTQNFKLMD